MDLNIDRADQAGVAVLIVTGELDVYTAPRLREALIGVAGLPVIVDLGEVKYLDSTGLGVLCGALKRSTDRNTWLGMVAPKSDRVLEAFRITGLRKVFQMAPDLETALAAANPWQSA